MSKELKCTRVLLVCLVVAIVCALAAGVRGQSGNSTREPQQIQDAIVSQSEIARSTAPDAIRPFPKIHVSQEAIDKLRRRIADTQWPEKETVADSSQGVPLATMRN